VTAAITSYAADLLKGRTTSHREQSLRTESDNSGICLAD
jgi:hypothetical protein